MLKTLLISICTDVLLCRDTDFYNEVISVSGNQVEAQPREPPGKVAIEFHQWLFGLGTYPPTPPAMPC